MAPRDPSRPKASDISDLDMLQACAQYTKWGLPFPSEPFLSQYPGKVVAMKLVKLERRGLINVKRHTTKAGVAFLAKLEAQ